MKNLIATIAFCILLTSCSSKLNTIEVSEKDFLTNFDLAKGELPEGLVIKDGIIYTGMAPTGKVYKLMPDGSKEEYGKWPSFKKDKGYIAGLTFDEDKNLYGAVVSFDKEIKPGVYVLENGQEEAKLYSTHKDLKFPNDIKITTKGEIFLSDSVGGKIYKVLPDKSMEVWSNSKLLSGDQKACPPSGFPLPLGINGFVIDEINNKLFAANTDRGSIVEISIKPDGSAGQERILSGPSCKDLVGADGLFLEKNGSILAVLNKASKIVRIEKNGAVEVLKEGGLLDNPASIEVGEINGKETSVVTNFGVLKALKGEKPNVGILWFDYSELK
ncbi:MAG: hypothetical protein QNJ31_01065 [Candidatus Caenarcaniphilales bacterium]|nr:hypothetical protein [Candidatus Caenarcaniphilales bacterium]